MTYWETHDPPMSFIEEGWSYEQKRAFRYKELDYLHAFVTFEAYRGKLVLCLGDGGGIDAIEFARSGARVVPMDMSEKAVRLANAHAQEVDSIRNYFNATVGNATDIHHIRRDGTRDNLTGYFDAVYAFGVLHHIPDVNKAVSEIARVLKPGGKLVGMVYNRDSLYYGYSILARAAREGISADEAMRTYSERNPGCPHSIAYTREELSTLLAPHFCSPLTQVRYSVIDTREKRKVRYSIGSNDLGWHLLFTAAVKK